MLLLSEVSFLLNINPFRESVMNKTNNSANVFGAIIGSSLFVVFIWFFILLWVFDVAKKNKR